MRVIKKSLGQSSGEHQPLVARQRKHWLQTLLTNTESTAGKSLLQLTSSPESCFHTKPGRARTCRTRAHCCLLTELLRLGWPSLPSRAQGCLDRGAGWATHQELLTPKGSPHQLSNPLVLGKVPTGGVGHVHVPCLTSTIALPQRWSCQHGMGQTLLC